MRKLKIIYMNLFKITTTVFAAALLTSCSGEGEENIEKEEEKPQLASICDCVKLSGSIMDEMEKTDPTEKTQKEIEASHADELEICDSISADFQKGFENLSQEEIKSKQDQFFKDCPEADELNKKMEAQMQQKMQQQMQQQQMQQQQQGGPNQMQQQGNPNEMQQPQQQQPAPSQGIDVK